MKQFLTLATALLLPFLAIAKDKQKILDVEKDREKTAYYVTVEAAYSSDKIPNVRVNAEFSYIDEDNSLYFGSALSTSYHYTTRGSEKWATFKFVANFADLPKGKITGYYVELLDKDSGKVVDGEGWKVSKAKHDEWKQLHADAKPLKVKQTQ